MARRPDSALNVYYRSLTAILDDAGRELAPEDRRELRTLLEGRLLVEAAADRVLGGEAR